MKRNRIAQVMMLVIAMTVLGFVSPLKALEPNVKMGKPTHEELTMTVYEPDPEAEAVYLLKSTDVEFAYPSNHFVVRYNHKRRIKVLKQEAVDLGDVTIVYYDDTKAGRSRESVTGVKASVYNLEDGKVVRSKLTSELKDKERVDNFHSCIKFSVPNVRVGSVIEYEYTVQSESAFSIDTWYAQGSYPVYFAEYTCTVPQYFGYLLSNTGVCHLDYDESDVPFVINNSLGMLRANAKTFHFLKDEIPALKDDEFVWCINEYRSRVKSELSFLNFPGSGFESYTQTWFQVDSLLFRDDDFGGLYKMKNPLAEEQAALALSDTLSAKQITARLRDLLMSRVKWNEHYGLWAENGKKLIKEGTGNSASIHMTLMSMLREAGLKATPVLLSRRTLGRLPFAYASLTSLNAMVLAVEDPADSTMFYVDATAEGYPVGVLPPSMLVERGRFLPGMMGQWVDLTNSSISYENSQTLATITADAMMKGTSTTIYRDQAAASFRKDYRNRNDSADYVGQKATKHNLEIDDYRLKYIEDSGNRVEENITFSKDFSSSSDRIYVNPFFFLDMTSPFKAEKRELPVEFACQVSRKHNIIIELPDNYEVEEMPKSITLKMDDGKMSCRVLCNQENNKLNFVFNYSRKTLFYGVEEYQSLRDFWHTAETTCQSMVVLKKKGL